MKSPINSRKHIVQYNQDTTVEVSNKQFLIASAVDIRGTDASDVTAGAVVKAVYFEMWLVNASQTAGSCTLIVYKTSSGAPEATGLTLTDLDAYENKKNIFFTTQGLVGPTDTNPIPVHRGWIKIPKGKQRMGLGDSLRATLRVNVENTNSCGLAIYKSYN